MKAYIKDFMGLAEKLGWSANYKEQANKIALQQYSPLGEEFVFCLDAGADELNLAIEVNNLYQNFEPERRAVISWERERGFGLRDLLDDAEIMDNKLQELNREYQY